MPDIPPLVPTDLPTPTPDVASSEAEHALPSPLNAILGRDEEIERIRLLLDRDGVRLLTLLGPGGVGKTRLALEVMRKAGDDFAHGAHFVPLAPVRDHALVPFAVAKALGIQESGGLPTPEVLTAWFRPRHLLLVLDNLEQVVAAASPWLTDVLGSCPRLTVLVTSRIALNVTGEQRHHVPPLAVPDPSDAYRLDDYASVALFVQRARAVQSSFTVTSANLGTIAEICMRLDGLPLAIELAAARLNVFSPAELLARLTDRFGLLAGNLRDAPPRLRSLRDAIGWSYDLLTPQEQLVHSRLSVFVGSFSLDASEFVAASSPELAVGLDTSGMVATLIDQSLVERADGSAGTRFRMLETIREYGLAWLAERGQLDAARDAHAAYYKQLAIQAEAGLKGPDQVWWLNRLEDEHGNLREAMTWLTTRNCVPEAIELFSNITHFMHVRAHFTEWGQLLDEWFALPKLGCPTRTRAQALLADGLRTSTLGEPASTIRSLEEAVELFQELGDLKMVTSSLHVLSFAHWAADDLDRARVANDESMQLATRLGDTWTQTQNLWVRANIVWYGGDTQRARQLLGEALAVARLAGNQCLIGLVLGTLGGLAVDTGEDMAAAAALFHESMAIQEALGDQRNVPIQHLYLAMIARLQGDLDTAESHIETGMAMAQATGQAISEAVFHLELGIVAHLRHERERSVRELRQAVRLFQPARYAPDLAECLKVYAAVAYEAGEAAAAARFLGGADALLCGIQTPPYVTRLFDVHAHLPDTLRGKLGQAAFERTYAEAEGWSVDDAVAAALAFELAPGPADQPDETGPVHGLSPRELDVLRLMANGLSNQQIADELFLSRRTVTSHVTHILGKMDLASRTAAVSLAIRAGIA